MTTKNRGIVGQGDTVILGALFRDTNGDPADLNAFPQIKITQPDSTVYLDYTSAGVYKTGTGSYAFNLDVPINGIQGLWTDEWLGYMGLSSMTVTGTFNFVVLNMNVPDGLANDGYEELGDVPNFTLSAAAIHNINILMQILRKRLQSSGWHMIKDANGNLVRETCDIFSIDEMFAFLCASLSEFNSTPHFTWFTWEDDIIIDFRDVIVEGAYIMSIGSKALIEKGREFTISDSGVSFNPPAVADFLNSQMSSLLSAYRDKLKQIKVSCKPYPMGLGTLRVTSVAPQMLRLRHLRERRFFVG